MNTAINTTLCLPELKTYPPRDSFVRADDKLVAHLNIIKDLLFRRDYALKAWGPLAVDADTPSGLNFWYTLIL